MIVVVYSIDRMYLYVYNMQFFSAGLTLLLTSTVLPGYLLEAFRTELAGEDVVGPWNRMGTLATAEQLRMRDLAIKVGVNTVNCVLYIDV